jgi:signal transduction histidine kinase/CHASE3 domain sensor protein
VRRAGLYRRMLWATAALAVLLAAAFLPLLVAIGRLRDSERSARMSERAIGQANETEKLLLDAEAGVRGFVITRDERFLAAYRSARRALPAQSRNLIQDLQDDPAQEERARTVDRRARRYVDVGAPRLIALARRDRGAAEQAVAAGAGTRTLDALRARFARITAEEDSRKTARARNADAAARRALELGVASVVAAMVLMLLFGVYLGRAVVEPVRRLADAAKRLQGGDLGARVPAEGYGEVAELSDAFNAMASSLEESRAELESQNTELGVQATELEDQKRRLAEEKDRVERFGAFADRLVEQTSVDRLAALVLSTLADAIGAEVGTLYARRADGDALELLVARGLDPGALPQALTGGSGLAGRAVAEGRAIVAAPPDTRLHVESIAGDDRVRRELHLPLSAAGEPLGVVSLGRASGAEISLDEIATVGQLADQAAVALANALAGDETRRLATITGAIVDGVADAIVLTDPDGRLLMANPAARRLIGELVDAGADAGREPDDATLAAVAARTTDPEGFLAGHAAIAADPEHETFDEFTFAGSGRAFQRVTAPVHLPDGTRLGRLAVARDVTRERAADRLKSELVATVSHELRTPLASVLGYTELLLTRETDPATRTRCLRAVQAEATRLRELIDDFLDLQRIERGGVEPAVERLDLRAVVAEQVERLGAVSERHTLEVVAPPGPLVVDADRTRLGQAVANLVSNAIKYSPDGGPVRIEALRGDGSVCVAVSDEGIGIPSGQQAQVFQRFFRARHGGGREIGGTGLGLALVREIVEAHGGEVGFDSVEERGSRFWFSVPAAAAAGAAAAAEAPVA